jgi:hypothetical protein
MSAGCYYTHESTGTKAAWIDLTLHEPENGIESDFLGSIFQDLEHILESNGWDKRNSQEYSNGLYRLFLDFTHQGDGLIIRIEPKDYDGYNTYEMALANHHRSENKILRAISKAGYKLRIATGGYTSAEFNP